MAKGRIGDLLVSSCFKGRISGKAIGDYQIGEHKNPLYSFNVSPTKSEEDFASYDEDLRLNMSIAVQLYVTRVLVLRRSQNEHLLHENAI
jgi:hypothetical protein